MKRIIEVDSRACGAGKTTQGIYPRIKQLRARCNRVLLVVPSIDLQNQYQRDLARSQRFDPITIINTNLAANVGLQLKIAVNNPDLGTICITHQAWLQNTLTYQEKSLFHLIIDESIPVWSLETVEISNRNLVAFNQCFELDRPGDCWSSVSRRQEHATFFGVQWQRLMDVNWDLYAKGDCWSNLTEISQRFDLVRSLSLGMLEGYKSHYVAAARFECTEMALWIETSQLYEFRILHKFQPHAVSPEFYTMLKDQRWTRYLRENNPGATKELFGQVDEILAGEPCLMVKNRDELAALVSEQQISHNCHGKNEYKDYTNICLASAINPSPRMADWYRNQLDLVGRSAHDHHKKTITGMYTAYIFYQLIMRTALRDPNNSKPVRVFLFDTLVVQCLFDFFDTQLDQLHQVLSFTTNKKTKKTPMTNAEKQKRLRDKQKALRKTYKGLLGKK